MNKNKFIIVGSGIAGLVSALLIKKRLQSSEVTVIEKSNKLGGLLNSQFYKNGLIFDHGMHNTNETLIPELDEILWSILGSNWNILSGVNRDLAGCYFNSKTQINSVYPDLREVLNDYKYCFNEIIKNYESWDQKPEKNAFDILEKKFGKEIAKFHISPILEKTFFRKSTELHPVALSILPLDRIILNGQNEMHNIVKFDGLRSRLAFEEQRNMPLIFSSGKKSLYPKTIGSFRIIDSIYKKLISQGVKFYRNTYIEDLKIKANKITEISINSNGVRDKISNISFLNWTVGLPQLGNLLKIDFSNIPFEKGLFIYAVHLILKSKPYMKDLHYLHCYDQKMRCFRINNYINYTNLPENYLGYPLSMELIFDSVTEPNIVKELAISELKEMRIVDQSESINFVDVKRLPSSIPLPSLNNINSLNKIRNKISDKFSIKNLLLAGILSKPNLFFQRDVLPDMYNTIIQNL